MFKNRTPPVDPIERLLHVERLWSFETGNLEYILLMLKAIERLEKSLADRNFNAVRAWLMRLTGN